MHPPESQHEWRKRASANPSRFFRTELRDAIHEARVAAAYFCGVEPGDFGLLTTNGEAIETVFNALTLGPGDEVIVTSHVDPRLKAITKRVAGRVGARIVTASVPAFADLVMWETGLQEALTSRTRAVMLEQVTAGTAELVPVQSLARSLRSLSLTVIVDGSQAIGMIGDPISRLGQAYNTTEEYDWLTYGLRDMIRSINS